MPNLRPKMTRLLISFFAVSLALVACQKVKQQNQASRVQDSASSKEPPPFTPPEIRRATKDDVDSANQELTKPAVETATTNPKPPKTVAAEKKEIVTATPPPETLIATPSSAVQPSVNEGEYVLQIAIHRSEAGARAMVQNLSARGVPAYALPVATGSDGLSGSYWRVRVGRFSTRKQAETYGKDVLAPLGHAQFWVDRKANEGRSAAVGTAG